MQGEEIDWMLVMRYLNGDASPEERLRIENWASSDTEHEQFLEELRQIWNSPTERKEHWDSKESWLRYKANYGFDSERKDLSHINTAEDGKNAASARTSHWQAWGMAAAVIFAIVFVSIAVYQMQDKEVVAVPKKKYVTKIGQQARLHFNDGTNVYLNASSTLKAPQVFSDTLREVWLMGQAYFDVAHNPDKPFIVHTGRARTKVLGTRFDVRAYPENSDIQVVVAQGMVSLKENHVDKDNLISKHQKGILAKDGSVKVSAVSNLTSHMGWRKGKLVFDNEPFVEVVSRLERWYDLDINFDKALSDRRLTARFTIHQPLNQVLEAIALTMDITYTQKDSTISFN